MRYRALGALALTLTALACVASVASADIVDLSNGVRLPKKKSIETPWNEYPSDAELRASGRNNLKLAYDECVLGSQRIDAAQIQGVYITTALANVHFVSGVQNGIRGYWEEAAEAFRMAADDLEGAAKQEALYNRMLAVANTNKPAATLKAADELLASDPKTYYFGPAQEMRAKVFATNNQLAHALGALKLVGDAPKMNVRDKYSAAYMNIWLSIFIRAQEPAHFAQAEKAFEDLLNKLSLEQRHQLATAPRLKIMMSLAASIRSQGRREEAKKMFEEVLAKTDKRTETSVLVGVYYGLGDVAFEEAAAKQEKIQDQPHLKEEVKQNLEVAVLHYLRVLLLYKDSAGQRELFGASRGAALVFSRLFDLSDEKDCESARRAYAFYVQAVGLQPRGEARRLLVREGKALKQRIDELCKEKEEAK